MNIKVREYKKEDKDQAQDIFKKYWTDPEFLEEISEELDNFTDFKKHFSGFIVAEDNNEIIGIAGYKETPNYLKDFARTDNTVELYVITVKEKRNGVGKILKSSTIEKAKENKFSEILLFSPESHKESWSFQDIFDFERMGEVTPPEDEKGQVWSRIL
jgi:N-acetylglutamate synthase-like GNAT family acetyltransferase